MKRLSVVFIVALTLFIFVMAMEKEAKIRRNPNWENCIAQVVVSDLSVTNGGGYIRGVITTLHNGNTVITTGQYVDIFFKRWVEIKIPGTKLTGWVSISGLRSTAF